MSESKQPAVVDVVRYALQVDADVAVNGGCPALGRARVILICAKLDGEAGRWGTVRTYGLCPRHGPRARAFKMNTLIADAVSVHVRRKTELASYRLSNIVYGTAVGIYRCRN